MLDCRRTNAYFRSPPGVDLLTGEGLGRIEVESLDQDSLSALVVYLSTGDVADCFQRMKLLLLASSHC